MLIFAFVKYCIMKKPSFTPKLLPYMIRQKQKTQKTVNQQIK